MHEHSWTEINRDRWDERVPLHLTSDFYAVDEFVASHDSLSLLPMEPGELGDVRGSRLLHLQCHIGVDSLSWARLGARVVGVDFSAEAVAAAGDIARRAGIDQASFVAQDVYSFSAEECASGPFDVVYTGKGSLNWLHDLERWAQMVSDLLAPGGLLYLVEFHPVADVMDEEDCTVAVDDYFRTGPHRFSFPGTFTDRTAPTEHNGGIEWRHQLGRVVSAVAAAGLRIEFLHEHAFTTFQYFDRCLVSDDARIWTFAAGSPARIPLMYSLRAVKQ